MFHEGNILLTREKDVEWWGFPGGGIDYGEDIRTALERELEEEIGISAHDLVSDLAIVHISTAAVVGGVPRANLFYRVDVPADKIVASNEVVEFRWFAPSEITPAIAANYVGPGADDAAALINVIRAQAAN